MTGLNKYLNLLALPAVCVTAVLFCTAAPAASTSVAYQYDSLGRLVSALYPNGMCNVYVYDAAGNRTSYAVNSAAAPVANPVSVTAYESSSTDSLTIAFDPRGGAVGCGPLTVSAITSPSHGSAAIVQSGAAVSYTPNANFTGTDTFTYTLYDGHNHSSPGNISVNVQAPTLPPTATNGSGTTGLVKLTCPGGHSFYPSFQVSVASLVSDPYGYALTLTAGPAQYGTLQVSGLTITYTSTTELTCAGGDFKTVETFPYKVTDPFGHSGSALMTATVNAIVQGP